MSAKDEIVGAIKSLLDISEKDFQKTYVPNGENDERAHFFAGKVAACREMLKYIGTSLPETENTPTTKETDDMSFPAYRRLWDYPLLAELMRKTEQN